jgi:hypothetical protein
MLDAAINDPLATASCVPISTARDDEGESLNGAASSNMIYL